MFSCTAGISHFSHFKTCRWGRKSQLGSVFFNSLEVKLTDHRAFYRPTLLPGDKRSTFHTRRCPQRPSDSFSQGELHQRRQTQIELQPGLAAVSPKVVESRSRAKTRRWRHGRYVRKCRRSTNAQTLKLYCFLFLYAVGLTAFQHLTGLCFTCKNLKHGGRTHTERG